MFLAIEPDLSRHPSINEKKIDFNYRTFCVFFLINKIKKFVESGHKASKEVVRMVSMRGGKKKRKRKTVNVY